MGLKTAFKALKQLKQRERERRIRQRILQAKLEHNLGWHKEV
jgi:hypothetical protein